jgi:hypothetical protein
MATQSLEFAYTQGQTLTARLFAIGSDTVVATAGSVTQATNRKNRYIAAFEDVPAGRYLLIYSVGSVDAGSEIYELTLATATFQPESEGGGGLAGDYNLTVTVTDADDSAPIENATVTLSRTGERGAELTNVNGVAVVGLDAATWSWIVRAAGYESATGTVVVSGDQALSVELDGIVVETPSNPDSSVLTVLCLDELGDPEPGVDIDIRIVTVPSGDTNIAYKGVKQTATSDVNGIASLQAIKGAIYEYKRGKAEVWKQVTIGSGATTNVSSFIGSP